jgi:hypothetical protein
VHRSPPVDGSTGSAQAAYPCSLPTPSHLRDIPAGYVWSPQLRPYRCYFFTDDAQMFAVGTKLKIMSLRNWRRLTNRMRLRMAIAEKRSLGTWCKWRTRECDVLAPEGRR